MWWIGSRPRDIGWPKKFLFNGIIREIKTRRASTSTVRRFSQMSSAAAAMENVPALSSSFLILSAVLVR